MEESLFTGENDNWTVSGDAVWSIQDGVLIGQLDSGSGFVTTKMPYRDFELTLEFMPDSSINSGVFVRCKQKMISAEECCELNIWDLHPNQNFRTGAAVGRSEPLAMVQTLNKWNSYKIRAQGGAIAAWVNGEQTVDLRGEIPIEGFIALQAAGSGEIRFRNVMLRSIR